MDGAVLSVTELNNHIKNMLDSDPLLQSVAVRGELSNYKVYPSGHHYFTLKDPESALRCVMFRGNASRLHFKPASGMGVTAVGRLSVYPRDGAYQLYVEQLLPEGTGDLALAFEQLKEKLQREGLFDPAHKKPIPRFPQTIAVVTSSAGAAVRDIIRVLGKRWPAAKVVLLPVRVQGTEAPPEIVGAIRYANKYRVGDVLIVGRGGGSIEDLWAFNDERVARAIYDSELPVISAVGHEPDFTIADFVADLRAATPSNEPGAAARRPRESPGRRRPRTPPSSRSRTRPSSASCWKISERGPVTRPKRNFPPAAHVLRIWPPAALCRIPRPTSTRSGLSSTASQARCSRTLSGF